MIVTQLKRFFAELTLKKDLLLINSNKASLDIYLP